MTRTWGLSVITLAADQLTKYLVVTQLAPGESWPLLPGYLHLTYVQNTGAAFGLLRGYQTLFIAIAVAVIAWVGRELLVRSSRLNARLVACALILGGAAGNLVDRLRLGYVVDFIDVRVWPVFNVGDSAITIGVTLLIWRSLRRK